MLDFKKYSKTNKLQDAAFVQIKNPETGELEFSEGGDKIGFELYSMHSKEFKRAHRSTSHLGLDKAEQERQKKINEWSQEGVGLSEDDLDFIDYCEDKSIKRMQRVFAMVTKKLHHVELPQDYADEIGIKITPTGKVKETVDNIQALYVAHPDLSAQIGDAIADKQNFINA